MASGDECCDYGYEDGEEEGEWDGAELEAGEDDGALLEEAPLPPPERPADCWAITKGSLSAAQQQELSTVMNLLHIKQHHARTLLIHHRWKMDCIYDHMDRKGRDRMLREVGIVLQENNSMAAAGSTTPTGAVVCNVCFEDFSLSAVSTMECGHCFCNDCWTEYFFASVDSGSKQIRCMEVKCWAICDEAVVQRLLDRKYPDAAMRFDHFLLESYLEDNDWVKWCPSVPHCGRAIRVGAGERYCEVECPCGVSFCFKCAAEAHSPCPCTMWERWHAKLRGESENLKWILTNTKSCPKCFKPIEKNGGCNLVRCKCGQCLCWLCGGATGLAHTWESIEGHSCNRFTEEEEKKLDVAKQQLRRYTHYYDRFNIHRDSYKVELHDVGPRVEERVEQLESDLKRPLVRDAGWLAAAHRSLLGSRQVLSRSYAFAYFMFGDEVRTRRAERENLAMAQSLFEDHQEQLEGTVERLSKLLATDVPALPEEEILRKRYEAITLAKIVETHTGEVYKCIQDELLPLLVDPMSVATYRSDGPVKAKEFAA